ncbi:MAG: DUF499 domain-containing protein [Pyrobaculum sp.]
MVLLGNNVLRKDIFDESLDERLAPGLGTTFLGNEHPIYTDPEKFFSITLVTEQIADILEGVARALRGEEAPKIILLSAFFGGGKTHTLITLYHALKSPQYLLKAVAESQAVQKKLGIVAEKLSGLSVDWVVVDGNISSLAPHPLSPLNVGNYAVRTLWGYLAHALGSYSALREYDEKLVVPEVDKLVKLFSNRRVVILVDEIAAYIKSLYTSADPSLVKYAYAVSTFLERLANAVVISKSVILVVSLPLAVGGEAEVREMEKTYFPIRDLLESVVKALSRVSARYIEPVTPKNIPALLKTRLFAQVDRAKATVVGRVIATDLEGSKEVFDQGLAKSVVSQVVETYPFHPLYINILYDILDKHERLQKTRDLLRITRAVLRLIANRKDSYELIMPWHIDLADDELGSYLLQGYEGFRIVVQTDLERARGYEKPFLAEIVAKALLAKTFVYGSLFVPRPDVFPTPYELAVMVYEPYVFKSQNLLPKDIIDAVSWIKENLVYVLDDERSGRVWFTYLTTPVKYVEDEARKIVEEPISEIIEVAKRIFATPIDAVGRRGRRAECPVLFDLELSRVSYNCDKLDYDTPRYILYACINVPEDEARRKSLIEDVVYYTKGGGMRRFANTIYVVHPRSKSDIPVDLVKKHVACKRVEEMGVVYKLAEEQGKDKDVIIEVLKNKLRKYCDAVYSNLLVSMLNAFRLVSHPTYGEGRNTVATVQVEPSDTVVKGVEQALSNIQPRKLMLDLDFWTLSHYLKDLGIDLSNMEGPKRVRDVIDFFYSNPALPAVPDEAVRKAIVGGVKILEIGLMCGNKIYFKLVEKCKSEGECAGFTIAEGADVDVVSDDCQILPWRLALVEQMRALRKKVEGRVGASKVIQYFIKLGNELRDVEEVLANLERYELEVLKTAPLLEWEREATVVLRPETPSLVHQPIIVQPNGEVEATFILERIGPFEGEVFLSASAGIVEPERVAIGNEQSRTLVKWRYKAPDAEGRYSIEIKALGASGGELSSAKLIVEVVTTKEERCRKALPQQGVAIDELYIEVKQLNLKPLQILADKFRQFKVANGKFEISMRGEGIESKIALSFENVNIGDAFKIVRSITSMMLMGEASLYVAMRLKSAKPVPMPSLREDEARELEQVVVTVCAG